MEALKEYNNIGVWLMSDGSKMRKKVVYQKPWKSIQMIFAPILQLARSIHTKLNRQQPSNKNV